MKNFFVMLCAGLLVSSAVDAQTKTKTKVKVKSEAKVTAPEAVKSAFDAKYTATTNNSWTKGRGGNYVVSFVNADTLKQTAEFDANGTLVRSKVVYPTDKIPENVAASLATAFTDATVSEIMKLELAGVSPYYKIKLKTGDTTKDILMSEEGTISE